MGERAFVRAPVPERPRVLYIAYWGAMEPLGRALLVPAVKNLAARGARLTLLTFEKPADFERAGAVDALRAELEQAGVTWRPARYHHKPQAPATVLDIAQGVILALGLRSKFDVVHGRTFVGGAIASVVARRLGARFVFHNEGYWARERVDAGAWTRDTRSFRVANSVEERLFDSCDGIFCLSQASQTELLARPAVRRKRTPVLVVPSCVDLEFFRPGSPLPPPGPGTPLRLVYVGTIGGEGWGQSGPGVSHRYRLDLMGRFAAWGLRRGHDLHLRVLTKAPLEAVGAILEKSGLPAAAWSATSATREEVRADLELSHAGLHCMFPGGAAHAGSPTKVGEYWAMGLPAVLTPGIGDTGEIARKERVGALLEGDDEAEFARTWDNLRELVSDPGTRLRCRDAAERFYGLDHYCALQMGAYGSLRNGSQNVD